METQYFIIRQGNLTELIRIKPGNMGVNVIFDMGTPLAVVLHSPKKNRAYYEEIIRRDETVFNRTPFELSDCEPLVWTESYTRVLNAIKNQ